MTKSTVYHAVERFKELGTSEDYPRSGTPRTTPSKKMIKSVEERVMRNSKISARQIIAKYMNMNMPQ